jgi:hypothetical protein
MKREVVVALLAGLVVSLPLLLFLLTPQARLRFHEVNIFSDSSVVLRANQQIENDDNAFWSKIIHNRRLGYAVEYLKHYFDNLNPGFLFIKGDGNPKFSIQDVGQLYLWEVPFLIAGSLFLFRKKEGTWWIIPYWIIIGIIPAGTARETPHALRIETIIPTIQILTAYGLYHVILLMNKKIAGLNLKHVATFLVSAVAALNLIYFIHSYFVHYPREFSSEWQYGYKEVVEFLNNNEKRYDNVIFTEDFGRPYIYTLFYKQYSPEKFRKEQTVDREALGFVHIRGFNKYMFVKNVQSNIDKSKNNLYVDTFGKHPLDAKVLQTVKLLNGVPAFVVYAYE